LSCRGRQGRGGGGKAERPQEALLTGPRRRM
jgi:hypothetical protein